MNLQGLKQKRAEILEGQKALIEKAETENRDLDVDEKTQYDTFETEFKSIENRIQNQEKLVEVNEKMTIKPEMIVPGVQGTVLDDGGFKSFGEFVKAVNNKTISATDNGVLVPPKYQAEIMMIKPQEAIVIPRAIDLSDGTDNALHIPALNQGTNGVFGGVTVYNIAENASATISTAGVSDVTLTPTDKVAVITVSDTIINNNGPAANSLQQILRNAIIASEDYDALVGNGTGCALGIVNATAAIAVNRNTSTDVKFVDVATMAGNLIPGGDASKVCWIASVSIKTKLIQMVDAGNHSVWVNGNIALGIPDTLFGIPVYFTGRTPALGTKGDLILADLGGYIFKRGPMYMATSQHHANNFIKNQTSIKITEKFDATPWTTAALTLENGSTTASHFVVLN